MNLTIKINILYFILIYVNIFSATTILSLNNNLTEYQIFSSVIDLYQKQYQKHQQLKLQQVQQQENYRKRSKRFVIFNGSGILKLVLGYSQPLDFGLKKPFQQLNTIYNFQYQFQLPTKPIYPWNTNTWAMRIMNDGSKSLMSYDKSRIFIYKFIESFLLSRGLNSKDCLLRTLCDVAQAPIHGISLFHDILRLILSSSVNNVDSIYWDAREAGFNWADCTKLYPKCKGSENWLKKLSQYY